MDKQTAIQPDEQPFTIGQTVYLREGTSVDVDHGCEPHMVMGIRWEYAGGDWWLIQVGRDSPWGWQANDPWVEPHDLVTSPDEIDPRYREATTDAAV